MKAHNPSAFGLNDRVLVCGIPCRVNGITRSARACNGGYMYSVLPESKRCLSDSIQYLHEQQLEKIPHQPINEVLETVSEFNRLSLVKG